MNLPSDSKNDFSDFIKGAKDSIWIFDKNLLLIDYSDALLAVRKGTREELKNKSLDAILTETESRGALANYQAILKTGKPFQKNYTKQSKEGKQIHIVLNAYKVGNGLAIVETDVTDSFKVKERENILESKANQYWDLLHQTGTIFFSQDKDLKYTSVINTHPEFDESESLGKTDQELLPLNLEDAKSLEDIKRKVLKDGQTRRKDIRRRINGVSYFYDLLVKAKFDKDGEIIGISGLSIDITNRKNGEQALSESDTRLKKAEKIAHLGYGEYDILKNSMRWSEETFRIFGIDPKEGEPNIEAYNALVVKEDLERVNNTIAESMQKKINPFEIDYRIIHQNGSIRHIRTISEVLRNYQDRPILMFGTIQDITDSKLVEFKLTEQKTLIQKVTDLSPYIIYILDLHEKKIFFYNEATIPILGYTPSEVQEIEADFLRAMMTVKPYPNQQEEKKNTAPKNLIHPDDVEDALAFIKKISQSMDDKIFELEHRSLHKSGRWVWLHKKAVPFSRDENGKIDKILVISNDISQLKKADSEAIDAMLEGQEKERQRIATDLHDALNPLLSITKLNIESLKESIEENNRKEEQSKLDNAIELLQKAMNEVKEISSNLMPTLLKDFGLIKALQYLSLKISEGETLSINFDSHGLKQGIDKKTEVAIFRISQELLNNIIKHANATEVDVQLIHHQNNLTLMIDDNGKGLDFPYHELMSKGFGFRNVESRVKSLDGNIEIDSIKGRGTTVTIKIPLLSNLFVDNLK